MEQAYVIARLKEITMPELLDVLAEANAGEPVDIYEHRLLICLIRQLIPYGNLLLR